MKLNTTQRVFWISALTVLAAEGVRFTSGAYDSMGVGKMIGVLVVAGLNAVLSGLIATRALDSEKAEPPIPPPSA